MSSLRGEISRLRVMISTITIGLPMNKIKVKKSSSMTSLGSSRLHKNSVSDISNLSSSSGSAGDDWLG